jgi:uncharacterized membrane protein YeaQ/YmgE (transglycosylase-associated protein family)
LCAPDRPSITWLLPGAGGARRGDRLDLHLAGSAPHKFHLAGILGSILGAILVLVILRLTGMEKGRRRVYR